MDLRRLTRTCLFCNSEFYVDEYVNKSGRIVTNHRKYCSNDCYCQATGKKNRYKAGWYKGIHCDSSWELIFVVYCLDHNINIERNIEPIVYYDENEKRSYFYPDFIVNNELIEIKGQKTENAIKKQQYAPNVKFLYDVDLKPYKDYIIKKYGKDFIKLYEDKSI